MPRKKKAAPPRETDAPPKVKRKTARPPQPDAAPAPIATEPPRKRRAKRGRRVVIVESPAKAKTIQKYLGAGYNVLASLGHVIDLPKRNLGIDVENGFAPTWRPIKDRAKILKELKAATRGAELVFLCPDPDREGEAIAWHLAEALKIPPGKIRRVTFNEITKSAIENAFSSEPEKQRIDLKKVEAQQARRLLDRIVGYKLSPLLQRKIAKGLSAGRVQSVAVRLIVDREREISAFRPEEYWRILGRFAPAGAAAGADTVEALLVSIDGKSLRTSAEPAERALVDEASARAVAQDAARHRYEVRTCERKPRLDHPPPPLTTSLLQQQAANRFRMTTKQTMRLAQQLYQGVEIPGEGPVGLITYMRTDSVRIAPEALAACRSLIRSRYGERYLSPEIRRFKARKGAQEAHEAVRPTDFSRAPEDLQGVLEPSQGKIYQLIWQRAMASQMASAQMEAARIAIDGGPYAWEATGLVMKFDGYRKLLPKKMDEEQDLPDLPAGTPLAPLTEGTVKAVQLFTQGPPRFSEASLVRTLEKQGIGRPSTYSTIISTIQDRGYVEKRDARFHATELGTLITDELLQHFGAVMDVGFTARIEQELDQVEANEVPWRKVLEEFYVPFARSLTDAELKMEDHRTKPEGSGIPCEKCGREMVLKWSRRGRFLGCPGFPACRNAKPLPGQGQGAQPLIPAGDCDKCGKEMTYKSGRFGTFLACTGYPECRNTRPAPTGHKCPKPGCDGDLVARRTKKGGRRFYGCSRYPACDHVSRSLESPEAPAAAGSEPADGT